MARESRYHIATIRKRQCWNADLLERQATIRQQTHEIRDRQQENHNAIRARTEQIRTARDKYEQEKRERLILGDDQKGPKANHNVRMREVEALFDLQSKQLSKLASCENGCLIAADKREKLALEHRLREISSPTGDFLKTICYQLQRH
jgi:hypothetical protein